MKDNFSIKSEEYAKFRPAYPEHFFLYLNSIVSTKHAAWDCGTGNGQVAFELAKTFDTVFATDISASQIANALKARNIHYSVQPAENTNFPDKQFDLIIVAQAIHWFDFEKFYAEVRRTAKKNAFIVVIGYGRIQVSKEIDKIINNFYKNVIGPYWDKERHYIDDHYKTIPFPFEEIQAPEFINVLQWSREHFIGYLNTWSAVNHFIKQNGYNPVDHLQKQIEPYWGKQVMRSVEFPLLLRIGRIL